MAAVTQSKDVKVDLEEGSGQDTTLEQELEAGSGTGLRSAAAIETSDVNRISRDHSVTRVIARRAVTNAPVPKKQKKKKTEAKPRVKGTKKKKKPIWIVRFLYHLYEGYRKFWPVTIWCFFSLIWIVITTFGPTYWNNVYPGQSGRGYLGALNIKGGEGPYTAEPGGTYSKTGVCPRETHVAPPFTGLFHITLSLQLAHSAPPPPSPLACRVCAEEWYELLLLAISRSTAYFVYPLMMLLFFTKANNLRTYLQRTYLAILIPFYDLHELHAFAGAAVSSDVMLHAFCHTLRWALGGDARFLVETPTGLSGPVMGGSFSLLLLPGPYIPIGLSLIHI